MDRELNVFITTIQFLLRKISLHHCSSAQGGTYYAQRYERYSWWDFSSCYLLNKLMCLQVLCFMSHPHICSPKQWQRLRVDLVIKS